jgi:type II secretory pathway component PulM
VPYVILAWVGAVVVTLVILGFCAYELSWKLKRLRTDAERLQGTVQELAAMQTQLQRLQLRATSSAPTPTGD